MVTSSSGYGVTSPAGLDPFPIESVLAEIVGKNNVSNAANMLDTYQVQRATSEGNYNQALQGQHDFARQQLAATMADNMLKHKLEAAKTPGGLSLISPDVGMDPNLVSQIETNLRHAQAVESAQKGGAAAASFTAAGAQPQQPGMDYLSGGTAGPVGLPEAERVAAIRAAGQAASGGGGGYGFTIPLKPQSSLGGAPVTINVSRKGTVQGAIDEAKRQGLG